MVNEWFDERETLLNEIVSLRRQVRLLWVFAVAALVFASCPHRLFLLHSETAEFGVVKVKSLYVTDGDEAVVALGSNRDGGSILVANKDGEFVLSLNVLENGGHIGVYNNGGKPAAWLTVFKEGGVLFLCNSQGTPIAWIGVGHSQRGFVMTKDAYGNLVWSSP